MSRWEYCAVHRVYSDGKHLVTPSGLGVRTAAVAYFTVTGVKVTEIQKGPDTLAQAIAELGEQGWEMVGCGNVSELTHAIYFKRLKA